MPDPFILPLESCAEPVQVGGKAAGLGRLIRQGFRVPPGICLTTAAYRAALSNAGLDLVRLRAQVRASSELTRNRLLERIRYRIKQLKLPEWLLSQLFVELDGLEHDSQYDAHEPSPALWAVRSSASDEDAAEASFAGIYRSVLGIPRESVAEAILECWASGWTPQAIAYQVERGKKSREAAVPGIAVIVQPLLAPRAAGVAYSRDPVTGQADRVIINAVFGLAEPLVSGQVAPDHLVVSITDGQQADRLVERRIAQKTTAWKPSTPAPSIYATGPNGGLIEQPVDPAKWRRPALADEEALTLAGLVKSVEAKEGRPVDVEWALDRHGFWLLQARPITTAFREAMPSSWRTCTWSRANFKETLPELPSPLALSYLQQFMENNILRHYREIGCHIPPGLSSIRIIRGRPYINVTLFQSLMAQLGGRPDLVIEQMGGQVTGKAIETPRLPWWRFLKAGLLLEWKILSALWRAPRWFAELKRLARGLGDGPHEHLTEVELAAHLEALGELIRGRDLTFAIVIGVAQALYVLSATLERRIKDWRPLFNAALQGQGQIISANQILRLAELAALAEGEPQALDFFKVEPWRPDLFRDRLKGTRFLPAFDAFLEEYGHRAVGESDLMVPRFAEKPDYLLGIIRSQVLAGTPQPVHAIRQQQQMARRAAGTRLRQAFGLHVHEWVWFRVWQWILARYLELREANRHHVMYYGATVRQILLLLGEKLASRGVLNDREDLFFLTSEELRLLISQPERDWKTIVAARRHEQRRNAEIEAPDTIAGERVHEAQGAELDSETYQQGFSLQGIPISAGYAEGRVCLIRTPADVRKLAKGDILVAPVIDPGWAPLFGLAAGLAVEMGGTLSHGAIIAREYGLPAVANVHGVTCQLKDGDWVAVDAIRGEIRCLKRGSPLETS